MRRILLWAVMAGILAFPAHAVESNSAWALCASDSDCVKVGTGCAVRAVHKKYQAEADAYYRARNAVLDCEPVNMDGATVACQSHRTSCKDIWGRDMPVGICASLPQCVIVHSAR